VAKCLRINIIKKYRNFLAIHQVKNDFAQSRGGAEKKHFDLSWFPCAAWEPITACVAGRCSHVMHNGRVKMREKRKEEMPTPSASGSGSLNLAQRCRVAEKTFCSSQRLCISARKIYRYLNILSAFKQPCEIPYWKNPIKI
jgi:hypothetical protein